MAFGDTKNFLEFAWVSNVNSAVNRTTGSRPDKSGNGFSIDRDALASSQAFYNIDTAVAAIRHYRSLPRSIV
jgi:hypothetical protein